EIDIVGIGQVQVVRRLLRDCQRGDAEAGGFERRADGAGDGDPVAAIFAVVDAGDDQRRETIREFDDAMLNRLGRRAIDGIDFGRRAVDEAFFFVNTPFTGAGHTAPGAALLFAWGDHEQVAEVGEGFDRRPQAGRGDAVVVREEYQRSFYVD